MHQEGGELQTAHLWIRDEKHKKIRGTRASFGCWERNGKCSPESRLVTTTAMTRSRGQQPRKHTTTQQVGMLRYYSPPTISIAVIMYTTKKTQQ